MFAHLHFNRYILKNFLKWAGIVTGILTFIIMLFSMVELIRKSQAHTHVHFSQMIKLSLLQVPHILDQLMPLIILFSTLLFYGTSTRNLKLLSCDLWGTLFGTSCPL
ncbi:MAG: LptF/LptG family permease [Holosporaceae bacterium]|nr:MAG: LptF/LptG family permease [Holosporaceae bacterium]